MILRPGMVFVNTDSEPVTIVDAERYMGSGDRKPIYHGPNLKDDLKKYGWKLDETSLVTSILNKYQNE